MPLAISASLTVKESSTGVEFPLVQSFWCVHVGVRERERSNDSHTYLLTILQCIVHRPFISVHRLPPLQVGRVLPVCGRGVPGEEAGLHPSKGKSV